MVSLAPRRSRSTRVEAEESREGEGRRAKTRGANERASWRVSQSVEEPVSQSSTAAVREIAGSRRVYALLRSSRSTQAHSRPLSSSRAKATATVADGGGGGGSSSLLVEGAHIYSA